MTFKDRYGPTALVAGASEGMGAAYGRALASRGLDLILVARRQEPLEQTATDIREQFGVQVWTVVCDLGAKDITEQIVRIIGDMPVDFLVYNAAMSYIGPYLGTGAHTHTEIARVNAVTLLEMVHFFGAKMVEQRRGGVVIMASIAGFQGAPYLATYAATKAFDRALAEGLWYEWKPLGVDVIACCAGATATPNYLNTQPGKASPLEPTPQTPEQVVEACLKKIGTTPSFVSGRGNRWVTRLMQHVFSRKRAIATMGEGMKKMYRIT